jgi:hypothetical protein
MPDTLSLDFLFITSSLLYLYRYLYFKSFLSVPRDSRLIIVFLSLSTQLTLYAPSLHLHQYIPEQFFSDIPHCNQPNTLHTQSIITFPSNTIAILKHCTPPILTPHNHSIQFSSVQFSSVKFNSIQSIQYNPIVPDVSKCVVWFCETVSSSTSCMLPLDGSSRSQQCAQQLLVPPTPT